jgi:hypothetical protein
MRDPDAVARVAELETEVRMLRELLAEVRAIGTSGASGPSAC